MKILTCFKIVPNLEMMKNEDWQIDDNFNVDLSYLMHEINCFDESALEITLRLADSLKKNSISFSVDALTIESSNIKNYSKTLYALGYGKVTCINDNNLDLRFWPEITANVISKYIKENSYNLVIMGRQSSVGDNAKTPLLVSEILGWPCITEVVDIKQSSDKKIELVNEVDDGIVKQIVKMPCVVSIGNLANSYLRVPTLNDKLKYGKKEIDVIEIDEFNITELKRRYYSMYQLRSLRLIDNKRSGLVIRDETPNQKVEILYERFKKLNSYKNT
jgi:electron transfer flavoprotein alpha/beta subunit